MRKRRSKDKFKKERKKGKMKKYIKGRERQDQAGVTVSRWILVRWPRKLTPPREHKSSQTEQREWDVHLHTVGQDDTRHQFIRWEEIFAIPIRPFLGWRFCSHDGNGAKNPEKEAKINKVDFSFGSFTFQLCAFSFLVNDYFRHSRSL